MRNLAKVAINPKGITKFANNRKQKAVNIKSAMNSKQHKSALKEQAGVEQPKVTNTKAVERFKALRKKELHLDALVKGITQGKIQTLSQGITLLESQHPKNLNTANELIQACLPFAKKSIRIGITGVPGVGKSTFIEAFGNFITTLGKKVAVLAVDPSSSISGGSILGDKTRMEELVKNPNAYIRPSASGKSLGGVARKTRESIILCEAAGYDVILVETVGVGQSETAVHSMVDFFLLLKLAGAGDELQGIKRGIMEMADGIVINKADGQNQNAARLAKTEFQRALHLFPPKKSGWTPKVVTCSALENKGVDSIWESIMEYVKQTGENGYFMQKREDQNQFWMMETINDQLKQHFFEQKDIKNALPLFQQKVSRHQMSPFAAAHELLEMYLRREKR